VKSSLLKEQQLTTVGWPQGSHQALSAGRSCASGDDPGLTVGLGAVGIAIAFPPLPRRELQTA
jgi:hypothetical protein